MKQSKSTVATSHHHARTSTMHDRQRTRSITRVISVVSGKGGVGKTTATINCGIALANLGKRVLILDADLGLANVDVLLGLRPRFTIRDVLSGERILDEVMIDGPAGISIIPAASGVESICSLSPDDKVRLLEAIQSVAHEYDYLLIDTQAGIGSPVTYFASASHDIIVVINAEPTSLTDAYALMKILHQNYGEKEFLVLANNVTDVTQGEQAFQRLSRVCQRFLHARLSYLGAVPSDASVRDSVMAQRAVLESFPSGAAGRAFVSVAKTIELSEPTRTLKGGMQFFFEQLLAGEGNFPESVEQVVS